MGWTCDWHGEQQHNDAQSSGLSILTHQPLLGGLMLSADHIPLTSRQVPPSECSLYRVEAPVLCSPVSKILATRALPWQLRRCNGRDRRALRSHSSPVDEKLQTTNTSAWPSERATSTPLYATCPWQRNEGHRLSVAPWSMSRHSQSSRGNQTTRKPWATDFSTASCWALLQTWNSRSARPQQ